MILQLGQRSGDWGSEVALWKATVKENPGSVVGWNNLGRAYIQRKKPRDAEQAFLKALALAPDRSDILTNLASIMLEKKDLASARTYFQNAVAVNPLDVRARLSLANLDAGEGEFHQAIVQYQEVLRIQQGSAAQTVLGSLIRAPSASAGYGLVTCSRPVARAPGSVQDSMH